MIAGAREGARAIAQAIELNPGEEGSFLQVDAFPVELQNLRPHEIHHFLCVYKRRLCLFEEAGKKWDKQLETDATSGKLDFLIEEAFREKVRGELKEF
jgi:hypothetical protein